MKSWDEGALWVVYQVKLRGKPDDPRNVVCEQGIWDELEKAQPGYYTLVREGIPSEGEAEQLARGTSADPVKRK
jgi:hypothetical protein